MSFSFSLSLIRYQENWWASDTELSGEQSRRAISYDAALKVLKNSVLMRTYNILNEIIYLTKTVWSIVLDNFVILCTFDWHSMFSDAFSLFYSECFFIKFIAWSITIDLRALLVDIVQFVGLFYD